MNIDLELAAKIVWCAFIVLWAAIRWQPNRKSRRTDKSVTSRTIRERLSMVVSSFGLGYIPAVWIFSDLLDSFDYQPNTILILSGTAVLLITLYLFRITHKALGKMWSHSLDLREGHKLITSGIYEKVRHPMYSAFWAWGLGAALLLPNWVAGFSGLIGFGALYFLRVGQEEQLMLNEFGDEYRDYMKRTKRIIPGIL